MIRLGVIEDVESMRALLKVCLEQIPDVRVAWEAATVPEAQLEMSRKRPDLVLLDEILPGMGGLSYLPELLEDGVRVILMTGVARDRPLPAGVPARLLKPSWETLDQDRRRFEEAIRAAVRA